MNVFFYQVRDSGAADIEHTAYITPADVFVFFFIYSSIPSFSIIERRFRLTPRPPVVFDIFYLDVSKYASASNASIFERCDSI